MQQELSYESVRLSVLSAVQTHRIEHGRGRKGGLIAFIRDVLTKQTGKSYGTIMGVLYGYDISVPTLVKLAYAMDEPVEWVKYAGKIARFKRIR